MRRWIWKWTARRSSGRSGRSELRSGLTLLCRRCGERILALCWQPSVFTRVSHRGRIGPWCRRRRERIREREEMLRETGMAEVNGARIYYEVAGEGDPLVLVNAGIATAGCGKTNSWPSPTATGSSATTCGALG